jgi:hypothetical protein
MNTRLLYVLLAVQALFAAALLYVGYVARDNRRQAYLELTHRVTSGQAGSAEYTQLAGFLSRDADKTAVRALFGLPVLRTAQVAIDEGKSTATVIQGDYWIYYPNDTQSGEPGKPVDTADTELFTQSCQCFLIEFDAKGRASGRLVKLAHPVLLMKKPVRPEG